MNWFNELTHTLFFTGKGGVGKTSLACATSVKLADAGKRVLLVSTDPASNLDHVFEQKISLDEPGPIEAVPGLDALNINPQQAAAAYRERVIGPVRGKLPDSIVANMEEQLSGACTTEIASFDQFTRLLADEQVSATYDHIVFDTAPTGHTLRLLELPAAWTHFLDTNTTGQSCLGPLSGLEAQRDAYKAVVDHLSDASRTTLMLVTRPEKIAIHEANRSSEELRNLGIENQRLLVNGLFNEAPGDDPLAAAWLSRQREAIEAIPPQLGELTRVEIPLRIRNMVGLDALRGLLSDEVQAINEVQGTNDHKALPDLNQMVDDLEQSGKGLIMLMGKGGVGKTTMAASVAIALADRGHEVHLATTDPAAHLELTLGDEALNLKRSRINPEVEIERYTQYVMETQGEHLDTKGRELLAEDLRSPCTEEIAVFQAFSELVEEANDHFVILDTAPTGHTLLLMDATGAYHREVKRSSDAEAQTPLERLRDPQHTRVIVTTLPETTPVLEAESLEADLSRAGISVYAWLINQSLSAAGPSHPLLKQRAIHEKQVIDRISNSVDQYAVLPWSPKPPIGLQAIRDLIRPKTLASSA